MKSLFSLSAIVVIVGTLIVAVSGVVEAASAFTPPLFVAAGEGVACEVVNTSGVGIIMRIIIWQDGAPINDSGNFFLGPRAITETDVVADNDARFYCLFKSSSTTPSTSFRGAIT